MFRLTFGCLLRVYLGCCTIIATGSFSTGTERGVVVQETSRRGSGPRGPVGPARIRLPLRWQQLPSLPSQVGLASAFCGVSGESLVVAGGVRLGRPLTDRSQPESSLILALSGSADHWREVGKLADPRAHGVSVTTREGVICLGGVSGGEHSSAAVLLRWQNGRVEPIPLPPLPRTVAFSCGALLQSSVKQELFVAGGLEQPNSPTALDTFWMLDLSEAPETRRWQQLPSWPGPTRMLATAGVQDGSFFLFGGMHKSSAEPTPVGSAVRKLRDAYRYTPGLGWSRIADMPCPIAGAVSPAVALGQSHLLVFGGTQASLPGENRSPKESGEALTSLVYHTITDTWIEAENSGELTVNRLGAVLPAMTTAVRWPDRQDITLAGGEIGSGLSTPRVLRATVEHRTIGFRTLGYVVLVAYLVVLVLLGCYFAGRASRSTGDFFLGGRRVPWWAAGISLFGTQISSITFMTVPGKTFATNWVYFVAVVTLVAATPIIVFCFLPFFRRLNITTAYEYLEMRFNVMARMMGSVSFLCFQLGRIGIVLYLPALSISSVTGMNLFACIVLMGFLTGVYCLLGGIEAVIWTDVLQVTVMVGSALACLILILRGVEGGAAEALSLAAAHDKFRWANWDWDIGGPALWVIVVGTFFSQFPQFTADQTYVQRYLTTSDERQAARSVWTNTLLTIPSFVLFFSLGTALWVFYKHHPHLLNPTCQTDAILPWFMAQQLPEGLAALGMAGLIAAAMSSLDSSLNSMATTITTDFRRFKPTVSDRQCLRLARLLTVVLAALGTSLALYMGLTPQASTWDLYIRIVGLFGGAMAGLFVAGIFTRRTNGRGIVVGFFCSVLVLYFVQSWGSISFHLFSGIGIVTCVLVGLVTSLFLPASKKNLSNLTIHTLASNSLDLDGLKARDDHV